MKRLLLFLGCVIGAWVVFIGMLYVFYRVFTMALFP